MRPDIKVLTDNWSSIESKHKLLRDGIFEQIFISVEYFHLYIKSTNSYLIACDEIVFTTNFATLLIQLKILPVF